MKHLKYLLIFISFGFLNFSTIEKSEKLYTTYCHQTFHFFFLTGGYPTFWIGEDNTGECEGSRLLQVGVDDSPISVSRSELNVMYNWGKIREMKSLFRTLDEKLIVQNGKVWKNDDLEIEQPPYDSLLNKEFDEHMYERGSNAFTWFNLKGKEGIKLPKIEGVKTELLFSYDVGLYINYDISDVHYFPNSFVIIFTRQPKLATGMDTMHGFLIYRIEREYRRKN